MLNHFFSSRRLMIPFAVAVALVMVANSEAHSQKSSRDNSMPKPLSNEELKRLFMQQNLPDPNAKPEPHPSIFYDTQKDAREKSKKNKR